MNRYPWHVAGGVPPLQRIVKMSKESGGPCGCTSDPTVNRIMDQTGARYNDRSAFANNAAMDNNNMMQSMFQAQAQNSLEKDAGAQLADTLALFKAVQG